MSTVTRAANKSATVSTKTAAKSKPASKPTASKGVQQELAKYKSQVDAISSTQLIAVLQLDGTIVSANENFCKRFGYASSDLVGLHHRILLENGQRAKSDSDELWSKLASGLSVSVELQYVDRSGSTLWLNGTYSPTFDADSKPNGVLFLATDASNARLMQIELDDLRVRAQIMNMTSIVSEADLKGDIISINEKFRYRKEQGIHALLPLWTCDQPRSI